LLLRFTHCTFIWFLFPHTHRGSYTWFGSLASHRFSRFCGCSSHCVHAHGYPLTAGLLLVVVPHTTRFAFAVIHTRTHSTHHCVPTPLSLDVCHVWLLVRAIALVCSRCCTLLVRFTLLPKFPHGFSFSPVAVCVYGWLLPVTVISRFTVHAARTPLYLILFGYLCAFTLPGVYTRVLRFAV